MLIRRHRPLVPAQDQRFLMPCGPSADQDQVARKLSATHGLPSLGERRLRRLVAPREGLDPETNRGGGAEDQQERDDPAHRWLLLPPSPASLEQPAPQYKACPRELEIGSPVRPCRGRPQART